VKFFPAHQSGQIFAFQPGAGQGNLFALQHSRVLPFPDLFK
jgi:hypothetical protein